MVNGIPTIATLLSALSTSLLLGGKRAASAQKVYEYGAFEYDPHSPYGPDRWGGLNLGHHEFLQWTVEHGNQTISDLRVTENECDADKNRRSSPVPLMAHYPCGDTHEILTRKIRKSDCKFDDVSWHITPHFLRATFPPDDSYCRRPHIDLPNGFGIKWLIAHMELHMRSEHVLDGKRFDAELQMLHVGQDDLKHQVAIVSMMLEASSPHDDDYVQWILDEWQEVADKRDALCKQTLANNTDTVSSWRPNTEQQENNNNNNEDTTNTNGRKLRQHQTQQEKQPTSNTSTQHSKKPAMPANSHIPPRVHRSLHRSTHPFHQNDHDQYMEGDEDLPWDHPSLIYGDSYTTDPDTGKVTPVLPDEQEQHFSSTERTLQQGERIRRVPRRKQFPYIMWPTIYYYRYRGSLTSPPCSRMAHWRVLDTPRPISVKQLRQMGKLLAGYRDKDTCEPDSKVHPITKENWRPVNKNNDKAQMETTHCARKDFWYWRYWPELV